MFKHAVVSMFTEHKDVAKVELMIVLFYESQATNNLLYEYICISLLHK